MTDEEHIAALKVEARLMGMHPSWIVLACVKGSQKTVVLRLEAWIDLLENYPHYTQKLSRPRPRND